MQEQIQHHRDVLAALRARLQSFQPIKRPYRHKRRRSSVAEIVPYSAPNAGPSPAVTSRHQPKRYKQPAGNVGRGARMEVEERREPRSSTPPPDPQKMPLEGSEAPGAVVVPAGPLLTDRRRGTEEAVPCTANHPSQDVDVKVTRGIRVEQDDYEEGVEVFEGGRSSSNDVAPLYEATKVLETLPSPSRPITVEEGLSNVPILQTSAPMSCNCVPTDEGELLEYQGIVDGGSHDESGRGRKYLRYALTIILQVSSLEAVRTSPKCSLSELQVAVFALSSVEPELALSV